MAAHYGDLQHESVQEPLPQRTHKLAAYYGDLQLDLVPKPSPKAHKLAARYGDLQFARSVSKLQIQASPEKAPSSLQVYYTTTYYKVTESSL